jgi:hypothetical protein
MDTIYWKSNSMKTNVFVVLSLIIQNTENYNGYDF